MLLKTRNGQELLPITEIAPILETFHEGKKLMMFQDGIDKLPHSSYYFDGLPIFDPFMAMRTYRSDMFAPCDMFVYNDIDPGPFSGYRAFAKTVKLPWETVVHKLVEYHGFDMDINVDDETSHDYAVALDEKRGTIFNILSLENFMILFYFHS